MTRILRQLVHHQVFVATLLSSHVLFPSNCLAGQPPTGSVAVFEYDAAQPIRVDTIRTSMQDAQFAMYQLRYASPSGGDVSGFLSVPNHAGRHPAVIVMHGLPGNAHGAMASHGLQLAAAGTVVLAIDAPWARRGGSLTFTPEDSTEQVQLIRDLRRAVDLLRARSDVDPGRIAYIGGSYGAAMGALLAGVEPRLAAAALYVGDGGLVAHLTDSAGNPNPGNALASLDPSARARWLQAMRPIEPIRFVGAARMPLFFQNGRRDADVESQDAEALHAAAPPASVVQWYDAGHSPPPDARQALMDWVMERAGIRATTSPVADLAPVTFRPDLRGPEDAFALGRRYFEWLRTARIDSLHAAVRGTIDPSSLRQMARTLQFRLVTGASTTEERIVESRRTTQYWRLVGEAGEGDRLIVRIVLSPEGWMLGYGAGPERGTPPPDRVLLTRTGSPP